MEATAITTTLHTDRAITLDQTVSGTHSVPSVYAPESERVLPAKISPSLPDITSCVPRITHLATGSTVCFGFFFLFFAHSYLQFYSSS